MQAGVGLLERDVMPMFMIIALDVVITMRFPINTIIAWIINDYHEQGNIIITNLLLPLGHISNTTVTRKGHHKIEPKPKHFSHCKNDQSSRTN